MSEDVEKILIYEIRELRKEFKELRKDLTSFKIKMIGLFASLITIAKVAEIYWR